MKLAQDPVRSAKVAGLRYIHEHALSIERKKHGSGFIYVGRKGKRMNDPATLQRIRGLVLPPAWREVHISPDPRGHLQAVGLDARGRKQYRYHPRWRETRDQTKYDRMFSFGAALGSIRRRVARDMRQPGLSREKVLATVVKLLETTLIRIGNEEYARDNHSVGLTTMRDKHVAVNGSKIHFEFRGKSGVERVVDLNHRRVANIIRKCQDLPGYELFQYVDEYRRRRRLGSADVNGYLKEITGEEFTAKDFRTWAGTVNAAMGLGELDGFTSATQAKRNIVEVIGQVARKLGNTKAVCRKCYVHPCVIECYLDGSLAERLAASPDQAGRRSMGSLHSEEMAVLSLLGGTVCLHSYVESN